jgi:hypothetical protein
LRAVFLLGVSLALIANQISTWGGSVAGDGGVDLAGPGVDAAGDGLGF